MSFTGRGTSSSFGKGDNAELSAWCGDMEMLKDVPGETPGTAGGDARAPRQIATGAAKSHCRDSSLRQRGSRAFGEEDDFAAGAGLEDLLVGARGLGQGQLAGDDGVQDAVFQSGPQGAVDGVFLLFGNVEEQHAADFGVALHGFAGINFDFAAVADDDDAAIHGEDGKVLGQIHVGQHFENDVGAMPVGQDGYFLEVIRGVMVQDVMGAELADELAAGRGAGS